MMEKCLSRDSKGYYSHNKKLINALLRDSEGKMNVFCLCASVFNVNEREMSANVLHSCSALCILCRSSCFSCCEVWLIVIRGKFYTETWNLRIFSSTIEANWNSLTLVQTQSHTYNSKQMKIERDWWTQLCMLKVWHEQSQCPRRPSLMKWWRCGTDHQMCCWDQPNTPHPSTSGDTHMTLHTLLKIY